MRWLQWNTKATIFLSQTFGTKTPPKGTPNQIVSKIKVFLFKNLDTSLQDMQKIALKKGYGVHFFAVDVDNKPVKHHKFTFIPARLYKRNWDPALFQLRIVIGSKKDIEKKRKELIGDSSDFENFERLAHTGILEK